MALFHMQRTLLTNQGAGQGRTADASGTDAVEYRYVCANALHFCQQLPDNMLQLIITLPPYNIGKAYETKTNIETYIENLEPLIAQCVRVLSEKGSLCWQTGNFVHQGEIYPLDIYFYPYFKKYGLRLRNRVIWHFGHGLHCSKRFSGRYETILWFTKSDAYTFNLDAVRIPAKYPGKRYYKGDKKGEINGNPKGKNPEDLWEMTLERLVDDWDALIWDIPNVKNNHPEKVDHPCQFPVELVERCVLALTDVTILCTILLPASALP
ncbi:MAG: site-specific DNA-methyltransferase [Desulfovibrio sp.]|nr:site-specific DNA-methyltransferase [Desulfovibrio sp.]